MTAALPPSSILVSLGHLDDAEQVITAIRTIRGVAGVKLVFGEVRAVPPPNAVRPIFDPNPPQKPEPIALPDDVIAAAAQHYRVTTAAILGQDRHLSIAEARHVAMFICKKRLRQWSYPELGRAFRKDHSSVISAVEKIEGYLWVGNERLSRAIDSVMVRLPSIIQQRLHPTIEEGNSP